jgi:hypothetical protein
MHANVNIVVEIESLAELGAIEKKVEKIGRLESLNVYSHQCDTVAMPAIAPPVAVYVDEVEDEAPAEVEAKPAAKKPAKKKAAKKKVAAKKPAAPAVSEDDLKTAVKGAIESKGIEAVRETFLGFNGKSGKPCVKMSDVREKDRADLVEALAS